MTYMLPGDLVCFLAGPLSIALLDEDFPATGGLGYQAESSTLLLV